MIAAVGDTVCLTAGEYNLGGDGQIYVGAFAAAITINFLHALFPPIALAAGLAVALIASCMMQAVCVALKVRRGISAILSTYIASAAVIPIVDSLITFRFRASGNLLATDYISCPAPRILPPSPLSLLSLIAPVLCVLVGVYMQKTEGGKRLDIVGVSNDFAYYAGINASSVSSGALLFSSAMHGAAGFVMVAGTYRCCMQGMCSGTGWSALTVALIALHSGAKSKAAIHVIGASLLLSCVMALSSSFTLTHFVPFDVNGLGLGCAIALIAIAAAKKDRQEGI